MKWWQDVIGFSITYVVWILISVHAQAGNPWPISWINVLAGSAGAAAATWFIGSRAFWGKREKTEEEKKKAKETFKKFTLWLFGGLIVFIVLLVMWDFFVGF